MNRPFLVVSATVASVASLSEWVLPERLGSVAADVSWTAAASFAFAAMLRALRHSDPRERRIWSALGVAAGAWLAGQVAWDLYGLRGRDVPTPSIADVLWLAFPLVSGVAFYRLAPTRRRIRHVLDLDAVTLAVSVGALMVAWNWHDLTTSALPVQGRATMIAYSSLYTVAVAIAAGTILAAPELLRRRDIALLYLGVLVEGVAFTLWCPLVLDGRWSQGSSLLDPVWTVGLLLIGGGALLTHETSHVVVSPRQRIRRRTALPAVAFVSLIVTLAVFVARDASITPQLVLVGAIAATALLVLMRNQLAFHAVEDLEVEQREVLARRNRELEAFAYSASHDLKAPLVSIVGFGEMLERSLGDALDTRSRHQLDRILANARSMHDLISDLFAFARSGADESTAELVDTNALVAQVAAEWRDRADAAGRELVIAPSLPAVRAHPVRLKQAIANLVDNALRYGAGEVRVTGHADGSRTEIVVEDSGDGVAPDDRDAIFDAFARGRGAVSRAPEGTGLGLALVKRNVEASGGDVRYEHTPGARFVLSFPKGTA